MKNRNELEDVIKKFSRFEALEAVVMTSRVFWDVNAVSSGEELIQISKALRSSETPVIYLPVDTGRHSRRLEPLLQNLSKGVSNFYHVYSAVHFQKKNVVSSTEGPFSVRNFIIAPFVSQCCVCR